MSKLAPIVAVALALRGGGAQAADCPPNFSLADSHFVALPMFVIFAPVIPPTNSYGPGSAKITMMIQAFKGTDGVSGCLGSQISQKGMPPAPFNPAPSATCTQPITTSAVLLDNKNEFSMVATYTFIGRIPFSLQNGTVNTPSNIDYRIIIKNGQASSVCYAPVSSNGTSEFWSQ